jgi:hypothetical protein
MENSGQWKAGGHAGIPQGTSDKAPIAQERKDIGTALMQASFGIV